MPTKDSGSREAYFPKIEAKYGQPMRYWFAVMKDLSHLKYPQQIAFLKEEHGFSQAHANALVMYSRGSKSSRRFDNLSILKNHILIAPWNPKVLSAMKADLQGYKVNKKTVQVPIDWKVDEKLLHKMIRLNLQSLKK
ncbi:MAG: DUF4287 domain-containing protein [Actinobacteria bacterium]|nr:DUF4287 domain-containing protein [Actinomycetota bacterium]